MLRSVSFVALLLAATAAFAAEAPAPAAAPAEVSPAPSSAKAEVPSPTESPAPSAKVPEPEASKQGFLHYVSLYGAPKYGADFKHFDFVNPEAPKGGHTTLAAIGTFDSLNPFVLKGIAAARVDELTFDTLLVSSGEETAVAYGLLAEGVSVAEDKKSATFRLRKEAKWPDGSPVTPEDVVFTFNTIKKDGSPGLQNYYRDVTSAEKTGERDVRFNFSDGLNRELPLIVGELPILPKKPLEKEDFASFTEKPIEGSGPYKVASFDMGRSVTFERRPDYWAKDLAVNVGRHNFDKIRVDFYRDEVVALEALKAGEYDFRRENSAKNWATAYEGEQVKSGKLIKEALPDGNPTGMQAFVLNSRRKVFSDPKVREAFQYFLNFEWMNKALFYGSYTRNRSFFGNSRFEAQGLPSPAELALLEPFKDSLPPRVFTESYAPPAGPEDGANRDMLKKAVSLLKQAGWTQTPKGWTFPDGSDVPEIEVLLDSPLFERVAAPMLDAMKKAGIKGKMRLPDMPQYVQRLENYDFDIITHWFTEGLSPGNELTNYWSSQAAGTKGTLNYAGVNHKAVDALTEKVLKSKDIESLEAATRALDRVLQWNFYVIPQWHSRTFRLVYSSKLARPEKLPPQTFDLPARWWSKEAASTTAPSAAPVESKDASAKQ